MVVVMIITRAKTWKKAREELTEAAAEHKGMERNGVPLNSHVNIILHSIFLMLWWKSKVSKFTSQKVSMCTCPTLPTNSRELTEYYAVSDQER